MRAVFPLGFAAVGVAALAIACHGGARNDHSASGVSASLRRSIADGLAGQLGARVTEVRCSDGQCTATLDGGGELPIAIHGSDWELRGLVIASTPLEQYLATALADLGVTGPVDCGVHVRAAKVGDRVECKLAAGGRAWATIRNSDGDFAIEIAVGADAVAARQADVDVAALDRLSAALDRGGADPSGGGAGGAGDGEGESGEGESDDGEASRDAGAATQPGDPAGASSPGAPRAGAR